MKTKIIAILTLMIVVFSCKKDNPVVDPVYEFVSFLDEPQVNLNEFDNSVTAYPVVIQLLAFKAYTEDITLTLELTASNAQAGVDFAVTPADAIKIPAGKLTSDTIWVTTIDNQVGTDDVRTFTLKIKTASKPDIKIGLGISDPQQGSITFKILDDECSLTTDIYDAPLKNTVSGHSDAVTTVTGVLTGSDVTVTGDLIDYGTFANASLTLTLTPDSPGGTKGKATFGEQTTGTDGDGYDYKFVEVGEGSYNVCSGTITTTYDVYYMDGDWVYWYSVTNVYSIP